jgi:hypothetical protein
MFKPFLFVSLALFLIFIISFFFSSLATGQNSYSSFTHPFYMFSSLPLGLAYFFAFLIVHACWWEVAVYKCDDQVTIPMYFFFSFLISVAFLSLTYLTFTAVNNFLKSKQWKI